jgi:hypothetical protein
MDNTAQAIVFAIVVSITVAGIAQVIKYLAKRYEWD